MVITCWRFDIIVLAQVELERSIMGEQIDNQ